MKEGIPQELFEIDPETIRWGGFYFLDEEPFRERAWELVAQDREGRYYLCDCYSISIHFASSLKKENGEPLMRPDLLNLGLDIGTVRRVFEEYKKEWGYGDSHTLGARVGYDGRRVVYPHRDVSIWGRFDQERQSERYYRPVGVFVRELDGDAVTTKFLPLSLTSPELS